MSSLSYPVPRRARALAERRPRLLARPELLGVLGLTAALNLWNLGINGWANTYYSAAVRSMSTSWHDFLFGSLDKAGLMTVDKPPLALWVQALAVRIFGFHPLSVLVPEALMGIVAVALVYDLVARRFGRPAGFVAGLVLATTPITVAISRHNNPDALLVLCSVAGAWCAVRALESGRFRWLALSGVCVGLGFEAKMGVALLLVPAIAAAWLWVAPRGRTRAVGELLGAGAVTAAVGLAWPLLVTLTPAADRPWISGTSDNSVWSLIFGYNGLGRVAGQTGGPPGGAITFGGSTGPFRLLGSALGDQAGWLLGFAVVAAAGLLVLSRLRRRDPATGWLIVVGGAFLTIAVVFSFAAGIFHPYYVSQLAPFAAALVGAGTAAILDRGYAARIIAPLAIAGGAVTEVLVLRNLNGQLGWAVPLVLGLAGAGAIVLSMELRPRLRAGVLGLALAALLAAPAAWAAQTLGHPANGTFPAGGPAVAQAAPGPPGPGPPGAAIPPPPGGPGGPAGDSQSLSAAVAYVGAHGGGTIGVESQTTAAGGILASDAGLAGLGGFSGRESSVTVSWLAGHVRSGRLRWVLADANQGMRLPGDTRTGSQSALAAVKHACRAVSLPAGGTVYDCAGRASAILAAARQ